MVICQAYSWQSKKNIGRQLLDTIEVHNIIGMNVCHNSQYKPVEVCFVHISQKVGKKNQAEYGMTGDLEMHVLSVNLRWHMFTV